MDISMKACTPYRRMATTCRTRPPKEKRIKWTRIETEPSHNGAYQVRPLRRGLLAAAAQFWRKAYPELYGSPHDFLFDPDQTERLVALEEAWEEDSVSKTYCMTVVEELRTAEIVSGTLLTKYEKNLQVEYTFAATHPDYRKQDLMDDLRRVTRLIAALSGAEYLTTFCETWHDITQKWCLESDWKIAGIFPGNFIRWKGDNEEYRGCTVHFYKFNGDGEEYSTKPEEWRLAPGLRRVWEVIEAVNRESKRRR